MDAPEPKIGQTWTLDDDINVTITNLIVGTPSEKIYRLEFRKPDGVVKSFKLREFLSRAVYKSG